MKRVGPETVAKELLEIRKQFKMCNLTVSQQNRSCETWVLIMQQQSQGHTEVYCGIMLHILSKHCVT